MSPSPPTKLSVPLPCGWGQGVVLRRDFSRVEKEAQACCTADFHVFTFSLFLVPFVWGYRSTGTREEEGADLYHYPAPLKVFCSLSRHLQSTETFQLSVPLSLLPSFTFPQAFTIPGPRYLSSPTDTCLSPQSLHCTWLSLFTPGLDSSTCVFDINIPDLWTKCSFFPTPDVLGLPVCCQPDLSVQGHGEQTRAVSCTPAPQHLDASCAKMTKALAMKAAATKNLQSQQTGQAEACEKGNKQAERRNMTVQHRGHG